MRVHPVLHVSLVITAAATMLLAGGAAWSGDRAPVIVIPGRPGVPVMWFGQDISYGVIEGDWGLERPGHGEITIILPGPRVVRTPLTGGYFPTTGEPPSYGRHEVEPPPDRALPPPAESYFRAWGAQSEPQPPVSPPAADSPPVLVSPEIDMAPPHPRPRRR